jgi:HK97 family phage major capsid protein
MDEEMKEALELMKKVGSDVEGIVKAHSEFKDDVSGRLKTIEEGGTPQDDDAAQELKDSITTVGDAVEQLKKDVASIRSVGGPEQGVLRELDRNGLILDERTKRNMSAIDRLPPKTFDACAKYMQAAVLVGTTRALSKGESAQHRQTMENIVKDMGPDFMKAVPPLNEGVAAEGLDLVPTPFEAVMRRQEEDAAVVRPLATKVPMTALTHQFPKLSTNPTAAIIGENTTIPDSWSAGPFGQDNLTAKKIGCLTDVSGELAQDNAVALMQFIGVVFGEQTARLEDTQALEGDGTGDNFTGLVAASGVNELAGVGANGELLKYANLVACVYKGLKRVTRRNAAWFMHPRDLEIIIKLVDSAGAPILNRDDVARVISAALVGGEGAGEGTLLGFPVFTSDTISIARTIGTSTDSANIYFGPMGNFNMIFGDLRGWEVESSDQHSTNFAKWLITIRAFKRMGILVGVPANFTKMTKFTPSGA